MTLVSIITPVFNAEKWLPGLFATVQAQSIRDWEHILIDDCSVDDSLNIMRSYAASDSRIRVIASDQNGGPAKARNIGIRESRGRFLTFLDADDEWISTKLEEQIGWMQQNQVGMSYHDYRHMSEQGDLVGEVVSGPDSLDWPTLHKRRGVGCLTMVFDRRHCPLPVFSEDMGKLIAEDFLAWADILAKGVVARRLPLDLARYRIMASSRSGRKWDAVKSVWSIYRNIEKIPPALAMWYWASYVIDAYRIHKRAKPIYPTKSIAKL